MIYDTLDGTKGNTLKISHRFELPAGNDFVLRTTLMDLNKDDYVWFYDKVEKETAYERNFFRIRSTNGDLLMNPLIDSQDSFRIEYNHAPHVFVRYINEEFAAPRPPYLNEKSQDQALKTDSLFRLELSGGKSKVLSFKKPGIYHIQADTSQPEGYTLFFFREHYPKISEPGLMILATRYLATSREYKALISSENNKKAIDKFWLDITGNPERARILIREYYTRVEQVNRLFYTHKPGWKTDRGMIYIIMGPPQVVYRSNNVETWIYGESEQYNALKLDFTKVNNPFTNNDYSLNRSPIYKDEWFFAIDVWRR
jgi:GWxTD domain-containing protein